MVPHQINNCILTIKANVPDRDIENKEFKFVMLFNV